MTGYQEIISDPSYADQIISFTYPHIGNVGINEEDFESNHIYSKESLFEIFLTNIQILDHIPHFQIF